MKFKWDEAKNRLNIRRHGIDFEDVGEVFKGPMIIVPDDRTDYSEDRQIGTGILKNMSVVIVFTEKDDDVIRIISARKANKHESKRFYEEITHRLGQTVPHDR